MNIILDAHTVKDPDGTPSCRSKKVCLIRSLNLTKGCSRKNQESPGHHFEGGDHPELDTSELCDEHQTNQFQTLIGQHQWLISLGRFDIAVLVMSLSKFRAQPREGTS